MRASHSCLTLFVAILVASSSFADKELWDNAYNGNWKPVHKSLKRSATAKQDLEFVPEDSQASVRDVLLDWRDWIERSHPKLYKTLFSENGLIGWREVKEDAGVDNFINAARIKEIFEVRDALNAHDSLHRYRNVLGNAFSQEELAELNSIYQDPDFKVLVERCEQLPEEGIIPETFELEPTRFLALDSFVSVLEVVLLKSSFDTTTFNELDHFAALHPIDEMLADFSNEQISALTEKLDSSLYRRELYMRDRFLPEPTTGDRRDDLL